MKVRASVKRLCEFCYTVRRRGKLFVYCKKTPRHKQRQWFASEAEASRGGAAADECLSCAAPLAPGVQSFAAALPHPAPPSSFSLAPGPSSLPMGSGRTGGGGFTMGEMHRQAAMLLGGGGSGRFWGR